MDHFFDWRMSLLQHLVHGIFGLRGGFLAAAGEWKLNKVRYICVSADLTHGVFRFPYWTLQLGDYRLSHRDGGLFY